MPPSANQAYDSHIHHLFNEKSFRKGFHQTLDNAKKLNEKLATRIFLENCLENDIIPPTFRINNVPAPNSSQKQKKQDGPRGLN